MNTSCFVISNFHLLVRLTLSAYLPIASCEFLFPEQSTVRQYEYIVKQDVTDIFCSFRDVNLKKEMCDNNLMVEVDSGPPYTQ